MSEIPKSLLSPRLAFAFAPGGLQVRYRASGEPQILTVDLNCTGKVSESWPVIMLMGWLNRAALGFAAGSDFPTTQAWAKLVSGPHLKAPDAETVGPSWLWQIEVQAMSPLYLRTLVDALSTPSASVDVETLRIHGSLALDDSPLSINEGTVRRWLEDREAYVGRPAVIPFDLVEKQVSRGAAVRVTFASVPDREQFKQFQSTLTRWSTVISRYPNIAGTSEGSGSLGADAIAQGGNQISGKLKKFDYAFRPAADALLGALVYAHEKILPIQKAEIAL